MAQSTIAEKEENILTALCFMHKNHSLDPEVLCRANPQDFEPFDNVNHFELTQELWNIAKRRGDEWIDDGF